MQELEDPKFIEFFKKVIEIKGNKPIVTNKQHLQTIFTNQDNDSIKAFEYWQKWVNIRDKYLLDDFIHESEIQQDLDLNLVTIHKQNKNGSPCIIVKPCRLILPFDYDKRMKFIIYWQDKLLALAQNSPTKRICVIYDRKDFIKEKNFDQNFSDFMMKNYRETFWNIYLPYIDRVYGVHIDWFFRFFFGILRVFLPSKFSHIPILLSDESGLQEYFDEDCLIKSHGGISLYTF